MYVAHNAFYLACILRGCDMSTGFLYEYTNLIGGAAGAHFDDVIRTVRNVLELPQDACRVCDFKHIAYISRNRL